MKTGVLGAVLVATMLAAPAAWTQSADAEAEREQAEGRRAEMEAQRREIEQQRKEAEQAMREAERQLAEAAQRIAELSQQRLPAIAGGNWSMSMPDRPVLGVTIGASDEDTPVEGVKVMGVTPGGAAAESGLQAGDVITGVNDVSLAAVSPSAANLKLLEFMQTVKLGDTVLVEYERDGETARVSVEPREAPTHKFAYRSGPGGEFEAMVPSVGALPQEEVRQFVFRSMSGWSDLELVTLTEDLGRYFGTDEGLLVVRAPDDDALKLRDGDVIKRIGGREPRSVTHAIRILGSYQAGETLEIEIMRDRRRQTLEIEMPDNRQGALPGLGTPKLEKTIVIEAAPDAPAAPAPVDPAERP